MSLASLSRSAARRVYVVGVGMTKFEKPSEGNKDYPELVKEAVTDALTDSKLNYQEIEQASVGYIFGKSTSGQRALYELGMTGIPIVNVNNNCATGSSALYLARQMIASGSSHCALALGFDKMTKEAFNADSFPSQANPMDKHLQILSETEGIGAAPITAQLFGSAGREHMKRYGTKAEHFGKIAWKNHKHSVDNHRAQQRTEYSLDEIMKSPVMSEPLTRLQCCPMSDGAAAAILVSEEVVKMKGLEDRAVEILGMEMATDTAGIFEEKSCIKMVGFDMTKLAADKLYRNTGLKPEQVNVVELHDCFSTNELITYEALGLCPVGKGGEMVDSGNNTYGGKYVVNPSGGLISKGHPLGATGLAQCAELCWQLRNMTGSRQVKGAKYALQHNLGLGGAVVVAAYKMGFC